MLLPVTGTSWNYVLGKMKVLNLLRKKFFLKLHINKTCIDFGLLLSHILLWYHITSCIGSTFLFILALFYLLFMFYPIHVFL